MRNTPPRHAPRAPRAPFALLVLGLSVGGMAALLALNTASAANELTRHGLASRDESVAAQVAELENAVAASAAPANLANAAGQLGMVPAGNPAFLVVGADGTVRVLGSPAAATGYPTYVAPHPSTKPKPKPKPKPTTSTAKTKRTNRVHPSSTSARSSRTSPRSPRRHVRPSTTRPAPTPTTTLPGGTR
ncbi:MAG: hypothetical protein M3070_08905 [Actinomycetota bacterium]|nr:hypothetical protein [Actinomycetota bacterium]